MGNIFCCYAYSASKQLLKWAQDEIFQVLIFRKNQCVEFFLFFAWSCSERKSQS